MCVGGCMRSLKFKYLLLNFAVNLKHKSIKK